MHEEFVPSAALRGRFAAGVVRRVGSLPLAAKRLRDFVRGRMSGSERQVGGLFESLVAEAFNG